MIQNAGQIALSLTSLFIQQQEYHVGYLTFYLVESKEEMIKQLNMGNVWWWQRYYKQPSFTIAGMLKKK